MDSFIIAVAKLCPSFHINFSFPVAVVDRFLFRLPGLGYYLKLIGAMEGTVEECAAHLTPLSRSSCKSSPAFWSYFILLLKIVEYPFHMSLSLIANARNIFIGILMCGFVV